MDIKAAFSQIPVHANIHGHDAHPNNVLPMLFRDTGQLPESMSQKGLFCQPPCLLGSQGKLANARLGPLKKKVGGSFETSKLLTII
jgi:hypothetical protein